VGGVGIALCVKSEIAMRILVLGTGPFAVPMFQSLLDSGCEVSALITRPTPPPKGREKEPANPMRQLAESQGLPVHAPASINSEEGKQLIESLTPELLVVCDYGQILSAEILALTPLGGINLHASLLPKYRGAAPIQWALLNGESETGVSVIHMTPRLDGGPILAVRTMLIGANETHPELEQRLAISGVEAVQEAIHRLENWDRTSPIGTPQDPSQATKAPRLKKEQGAVDWTRRAEQIRNQVRALKPWPGTFTFWRRAGQEPMRLVIDDVAVVPDVDQSQAGRVAVSDGKQLIVATSDGGLAIGAVAPAGKRHMTIAEFLRGYPIRQGDVLGSVGE
jgi:methionyl-tRNA formyltransferase